MLIVFCVFLSLFSLTYSPRNISSTFLSPSKQEKKKKRLKENANLSLRRFKASFSFFTSETLDRSSLGEGQSEGQKKTKKQTGERWRGSDKTFYKEGAGERSRDRERPTKMEYPSPATYRWQALLPPAHSGRKSHQ